MVTRRRGITWSRRISPCAVDVVEEHLQRPDALRHAGLDHLPLGRVDDARDQVHRQRPLAAGQGERDALVAQVRVAQPRPGPAARAAEGASRRKGPSGAADLALGVEHLVKRLRITPQAVVTAENAVMASGFWRTGSRRPCGVCMGARRRLTIDMLHQVQRFGKPESSLWAFTHSAGNLNPRYPQVGAHKVLCTQADLNLFRRKTRIAE